MVGLKQRETQHRRAQACGLPMVGLKAVDPHAVSVQEFSLRATCGGIERRWDWKKEEKGRTVGERMARLAVFRVSRGFLRPSHFVGIAYGLLGDAAADTHAGRSAAQFAYRLTPGGALLVAWGGAAGRLGEKVPCRWVPVPGPSDTPDGLGGGKAVVRIRHTTPTLLKEEGGRKVPWFDPAAYARALAGVAALCSPDVDRGELMRGIEFREVSVRPGVWDLGVGAARGFLGTVEVAVPRGWAGVLRLASLTGLGCKRGWGMGNVDVRIAGEEKGVQERVR